MHLLVKEEHHRVSYTTKDGKIGCKGFQQNKGINYIEFCFKVKLTMIKIILELEANEKG